MSTTETSLADGRYQLCDALGAGGTASVWRATDTSLGVERAIKLLDHDGGGSSRLRDRLKAEARAMARLSDHPNILRVYDIGHDGGRDFVVMELAPGGSLADWIERNGPMPPGQCLDYGMQILAALSAAHGEGIVHRDVKPHNVLLDSRQRALLADFGIALLDGDRLRTTRTGMAMGSLAFMAPEQRLDARSVGPEADIYAVGTTLYNLLTCENPIDLFTAKEDSDRWRGIPAPLRPVLRRATAYEPADRYPSAKEMAAEISEVLARLGHGDEARGSLEDTTMFPSAADTRDWTGGSGVNTASSASFTERGASSTMVLEDLDGPSGLEGTRPVPPEATERAEGDAWISATMFEIEEGAMAPDGEAQAASRTAVPSHTEVSHGAATPAEQVQTLLPDRRRWLPLAALLLAVLVVGMSLAIVALDKVDEGVSTGVLGEQLAPAEEARGEPAAVTSSAGSAGAGGGGPEPDESAGTTGQTGRGTETASSGSAAETSPGTTTSGAAREGQGASTTRAPTGSAGTTSSGGSAGPASGSATEPPEAAEGSAAAAMKGDFSAWSGTVVAMNEDGMLFTLSLRGEAGALGGSLTVGFDDNASRFEVEGVGGEAGSSVELALRKGGRTSGSLTLRPAGGGVYKGTLRRGSSVSTLDFAPAG